MPAQSTKNRAHDLKTDPEAFEAVERGIKTNEIRRDDRGYEVGEILRLHETLHTGEAMRAGAPLVFTGRQARRVISYIQRGYGLADGWVSLSFEHKKNTARGSRKFPQMDAAAARAAAPAGTQPQTGGINP
jgi:hypothetical protein